MLLILTTYHWKKFNFHALRDNEQDRPAWQSKQDHASQADDQAEDIPGDPEFWHCRECHHPITRKATRIEVNGQHRHICMNPHGYVYQIGCFSQAPGCKYASQPTTDFSWFSGYAWQIVVCEQCQTMLGWGFRGPDSRFWGLILTQLV